MKYRATSRRHAAPSRRRAALLITLALAPLGCGREFFREWANQDVSEAIFEKSRDPRWRIDAFSVEPPWMARYADPYDQDFPPAPPDDYATQSLSPIPQWSYNRLIIPVEGTGYLTMLEAFQAENPPPPPRVAQPAADEVPRPRIDVPSPPPVPDARSPFAAPPASRLDPRTTSGAPGDPGFGDGPLLAPGRPNPGMPTGETGVAPRPNSGTPAAPMTPPSIPGRTPSPTPPPPRPAAPDGSTPPGAGAVGPQARAATRDSGVRRVASQAPAPRPAPVTPLPNIDPPDSDNPANDPLRTPRVPGETGPREMQNLAQPINPRPDLTPRQNRAAEGAVAELSGLLGTGKIDFIESEAIGLPPGSTPYKINMAQALTLALINARVYQYQLEQLYLAALPVTLQRFTFTPQFIVGLTPTTPTLGPSSTPAGAGAGLSPTINPSNAFTYRTRATGLQQSVLNMGTVAEVGKSFDNGVKVLAGFASQLVFNFTGVNPRQPTVQSYLPMQVFIPFLKGGGRAVTLEGLTQAERNLLYQIRLFAKFRQEFLITTLAGGSFQAFGTTATSLGFSSPGDLDPTTGYLNVLEDIAIVENNQRNVETYKQFFKVYTELIKGESSGLTQLQLDQLDANLQNARITLLSTRNTFRTDLDAFKMQMGLPPDTPIMIDRRLTQPFKEVFQDIETWSRKPGRQLAELDLIAKGLPELEDVVIDGRSTLSTFRSGNDDNLEDLLLSAERVSLENRLDLMNYRAQLYDAWRQIRVTANALKGVLNVSITNQYLTPPNNTNPFGFLDQAKQFSLVLNAELPLVRINERNLFRQAIISYQRFRRQLQYQEDYQKLQLRSDVRSLQVSFLSYELQKRNFVLYARQKDQAFENIVAPPQSGGGGAAAAGSSAGTSASGATQTNNLTGAQNSLINIENQLITTWYGYQQARLIVYRDLGTLPYDEWEAFYEIFPSEYRGLGVGGRGYASPIDAPAPGQPDNSVYGTASRPAFTSSPVGP